MSIKNITTIDMIHMRTISENNLIRLDELGISNMQLDPENLIRKREKSPM